MFGWSNLGRTDSANAGRVVVERVAKASVIAGATVLCVLAASALSDFDTAPALFEPSGTLEKQAVVRTERKVLPRRTADRKTPAEPVLRVINAGTVNVDPIRHDEMVAAMARESAEPADAVTDDDDLTPTGTYADWYPAKRKTFRTVCVRTCDGAITPISFATTQDRLALDALRCRKSCGSPSKLYIQRNPSDGAEGLVDLDGKPYTQLSTAFKFRTSYDEACTCRPHAWQSTAQARHRLFGIQTRQRHGRHVALSRLAEIKSAAFKTTRVAMARSRSGISRSAVALESDIVTGSNDVMGSLDTLTKRPAGPAGAALTRADGALPLSLVDLDEVTTGDPKPLRKAMAKPKGKAAKARAVALAKAKAARVKKLDADALIVMFGSGAADDLEKSAKWNSSAKSSKSAVRSAGSTRRYDGNDWRISFYEPM